MNALTTTQTLPLTTSFRQRVLTIAASVFITLTVVAANLQIAQGYADGTHGRNSTAESAPVVRG